MKRPGRPKASTQYDVGGFIDDLVSEGLSSYYSNTDSVVGIISFAEDFIFNGNAKLFPTQRALLKSFYNEPLTPDEKAILLSWQSGDKTTWVDGRKYSNLIIEAGRGGGKSTLGAILALYEFYKLINLGSPSKHWGLLPNSPIAIFVIAQSQEQVKETLFATIKGYCETSIFFRGLSDTGKIEVLQEEVRCPAKNIMLAAKHTNSKSLVGYSIKMLILDEAARFEYDEYGVSKANEIFSGVGKGTKRFGDQGYKVAISSAWEEKDFIEQMYEFSHRDPQTLGFSLATWELNLSPHNTEEMIKNSEEYIREPLRGALEFENIRTGKQGTFLNPVTLRNCMTGKSAIDARQIPRDYTAGGDTRYYVENQITRADVGEDIISFAHIDYGIKKDSAALAIVRPVYIEASTSSTIGDYINYDSPMDGVLNLDLDTPHWGIQCDCIIRWKPYVDKDRDNKGINRVVSFLNVEDIMTEVSKLRSVHTFSFDSFNSEYAIQKLHTQGIITKEMSTTNDAQLRYYTLFKKLVDEGRYILPQDSYCTSAMEFELINLIQLPNGRVDHKRSKGFSKDIADALVNATFNCYTYMLTQGIYNGIGGPTITMGTAKRHTISGNNSKSRVNRDSIDRLRRFRGRSSPSK